MEHAIVVKLYVKTSIDVKEISSIHFVRDASLAEASCKHFLFVHSHVS